MKIGLDFDGVITDRATMEFVNGALEHITAQQLMGHKLSVITSRRDDSLELAKEWSQMKGLDLEFIGVGYGNSKAEAASGLDIYIDDDLDKLQPLVRIVPHLYLFGWPYNEHEDVSKFGRRVNSWPQFHQAVISTRAQ